MLHCQNWLSGCFHTACSQLVDTFFIRSRASVGCMISQHSHLYSLRSCEIFSLNFRLFYRTPTNRRSYKHVEKTCKFFQQLVSSFNNGVLIACMKALADLTRSVVLNSFLSGFVQRTGTSMFIAVVMV